MIRLNMMISFALYRQHCTFLDSDTTYIKDLSRLNRDMVVLFIYSLINSQKQLLLIILLLFIHIM